MDHREHVTPIAYRIGDAALVAGRSKWRLYQAIREKELTAIKDGKSTLIASAELARWVGSFKTIGRSPEPPTSEAVAA